MLMRPSGVRSSGSRPFRAWPGILPVSQLPFRQGVRLAVDVGSVRIGVARSDPGGVLAVPLTVLRSGSGALAGQARAELARLAAAEGAIEVIVGLPVSLSGREGAAAAGAREFAADLAGRVAPVPVRLVDERFTTTEAHGALRRGGKDSRARRQVIDAAAAAILLQAALDTERATGRPAGQLAGAGAGTRPALATGRAREPGRRRLAAGSAAAAEPAPGPARARTPGSPEHAAPARPPGPAPVPRPAHPPGPAHPPRRTRAPRPARAPGSAHPGPRSAHAATAWSAHAPRAPAALRLPGFPASPRPGCLAPGRSLPASARKPPRKPAGNHAGEPAWTSGAAAFPPRSGRSGRSGR